MMESKSLRGRVQPLHCMTVTVPQCIREIPMLTVLRNCNYNCGSGCKLAVIVPISHILAALQLPRYLLPSWRCQLIYPGEK